MGTLAILAAAGAIGGLMFWLIRRPDRDHLPNRGKATSPESPTTETPPQD